MDNSLPVAIATKKKRIKLNSSDIELSVASYFNVRSNLIVPNVSWGMFLHECDLLLVTKHGYAYEVEIKVSRYDLKKDLQKKHGHKSAKIKKLFFAIPDYMLDMAETIPEHAGILSVDQDRRCRMIRNAKSNSDYRFSNADKFQVARLGTMRIWNLKQTIAQLIKERKTNGQFANARRSPRRSSEIHQQP